MKRVFGRSRLLQTAAIIFVAALLLAVVSATSAQQGIVERYFAETGHTVTGQFLIFFEANGGVATFGFPITDAFIDPRTLQTVQYFQHARFEYHPNNVARYQVQLGLLGDELKYSQPRITQGIFPNLTQPNCVYFAETGHSVCNSFLEFFKANGGIDVFGYPITEFSVDNDRIVQVFQRMRMVWHPELASGQKVQLSDWGITSFNANNLNQELLVPKPSPLTIRLVTRLNVRATVSKPVLDNTNDQIVYLLVTDQLGQGLDGALALGIAHFSSGDQPIVFVLPTNAQGITQAIVPQAQVRLGEQVPIDIEVKYHNSFSTKTRASFLPWW